MRRQGNWSRIIWRGLPQKTGTTKIAPRTRTVMRKTYKNNTTTSLLPKKIMNEIVRYRVEVSQIVSTMDKVQVPVPSLETNAMLNLMLIDLYAKC